MEIRVVAIISLLLATLYMPAASAADISEMRAEADRYYAAQEYRKANKLYLRMAKDGDHYSQGKLAYIFAQGKGRSIDLEEAYAWTVLAEEGGPSWVSESSEQVLARTTDKDGAEKQAKKLVNRYGQQALIVKAERKAKAEAARRSGSSMGSNLSR